MAKDPAKNSLRSSYISLVVSVSLVLFLLGLLGLVLVNAKELGDYFRESLSFSIIFEEGTREADIRMLQKDLDAKEYVKMTEYVSKEEAAATLQDELGEDFITFLGENPLPASLDIYLVSDYTHPDSIPIIQSYISKSPFVQELYYQESLLTVINENMNKISLFLLLLTLLLLVISLTIINNTIRLSIYSKRFTIRTMQLVGATRSFIRKPFIKRGIINGIIASLLAILLLVAVLYFVEREFLFFFSFRNNLLLIALGLTLAAIGIVINISSTYFSVNKYLSIPDNKLYY